MKKFTITVMALISLLNISLANDSVSSKDAKKHEGKIANVCGLVVQVTDSAKAFFINFDQPYPNQTFYGVVWKNEMTEVGTSDQIMSLNNQTICIQGRIQNYKNIPNIIIKKSTQITKS